MSPRQPPNRPVTWHIGLVHGSIAIPGKTDRDEVVITTDEIAASGLDYLALGHWHSAQSAQGRRRGVRLRGRAGGRSPSTRIGRARSCWSSSTRHAGQRTTTVVEKQVGRTTFAKLEVDAATVASQPALIDSLTARADPDLVLDTRLVGVRRDDLDLDLDEIEAALAPSFLKVRVRDASVPALTEGPLPSPDTIAGAFIRDLEARIAQLEAAGSTAEAAEHRDALRLGRLLLAGHEVSL